MNSNKDRAAYTCFSAVLIAIFAFHTISVVIDINPLSGNLTSGSKTGILSVITLILFIGSAVALRFFNRKRECRTKRFKSRPLGVCSIAFAFAIVLESFSRFFTLKSETGQTMQGIAEGAVQSDALILRLQVVVMIVSAIAAVYLFALGFTMLDRKSEMFPPDMLCVSLPLWCVVRIAGSYVEFTNSIALTERLYDIPAMCATALMMISFTRFFCDAGKESIPATLSGYCLTTAAISLPLVASRIIASLGLGLHIVTAGWQDAVLQVAASVFALVLYAELGKADIKPEPVQNSITQ